MQLPRGTFREIRKGETMENLLSELERLKFSGVCSISSGNLSGTLVYKNGKCILVKFLGKPGDHGWDELQKNIKGEVDAALSSLDDAQIQLSLEFNKTCRIVKAPQADSGKRPVPPVHEQVKKPAPPVRPAAPAVPVPPAARAPQKPPAAPSLFHHAAPSPESQPAPVPDQRRVAPGSARPAMPVPPVVPQPAQTAPASRKSTQDENEDPSGQGSSFEKDIDTFDTMDLDNVTDKIRNDCKTMIKQLHLEHLMER